MINVNDLIYEIKLFLRKVDSYDSVNLETEDILLFLNKAQIEWIKSKLNPNNLLRAGYEETRKRIEDLQVLKNEEPFKIPLTKLNNPRYISFGADLLSAPNYMFYVESYVSAKYKKTCENYLDVDLIREGELNIKYFSENHSPSFEWRTTLATMGGNKLVVYSNDAMNLGNLYVTYLRYPKEIDIDGYVKIDGTPSKAQDSELPGYAKQDLIDLTVKYISHALENQFQTQATQIRLNTNE